MYFRYNKRQPRPIRRRVSSKFGGGGAAEREYSNCRAAGMSLGGEEKTLAAVYASEVALPAFCPPR